MMEYKGYIGYVEYDDEAMTFHGEVINTQELTTFQGESVEPSSVSLRNLWMFIWHFVPNIIKNPISHFLAS